MGTTIEKRKLHLINWDTITSKKENVVLGLQKSEIKNKAILARLHGELSKSHKLWRKVLIYKYHMPNTNNKSSKTVSRTWNNIQKGWAKCVDATS